MVDELVEILFLKLLLLAPPKFHHSVQLVLSLDVEVEVEHLVDQVISVFGFCYFFEVLSSLLYFGKLRCHDLLIGLPDQLLHPSELLGAPLQRFPYQKDVGIEG